MKFTPTEARIVRLLADGQPHPRAALASCLYDDLSRVKSIGRHLASIRQKLRLAGTGEALLAVYHNRSLHYQRVRLLDPAACLV